MKKTSSKPTKIFRLWGRNAKVLVATEALWSIPMSWVFFYRPVFLRESIGLSEVQIGLLATILNLFSIFPLAGGYLADRFGRKKVLILFDGIAWISSSAIWIITGNMWYALAAYILEGISTVIHSVWECLLVEDTEPEYRASIYGYIYVMYHIGALATPIAGYIIGLYGIDFGCRMLFTLVFALMIPLFSVQQICLQETKLGRQIMNEKKFAGLKGYSASFSMIMRNRILAALLIISVIGGFYHAVASYLPLYLIDLKGLRLSEDVASLVPAASSTSTLIIASLVVPKLTSRRDYIKALALGHGTGCLAILLFILSPRGYLPLALVSGVLLGIYLSTSFSVSRTFLTNEIEAIDNRARAKTLSITITLSGLLNLPTPTLAGYLFSLEPKLPFIALSAALIISLATLLLATK